MTGLLVTCTGKNEKMAVQDIYKILNEFAEELAPELFEEEEQQVLPKRAPLSPTKDDDLTQELNLDREERVAKPKPKRMRHFQQMRMRAKGIIFIIMNESLLAKITPHALSKKILDSVEETRSLLTRYCSRIYPVEYTMDANLELFQTHAKHLVEKYFPKREEGPSVTWSFRFKCRSNSKYTRNMFLTEVIALIPSNYMYLEYHGSIEFFVDITQHTMCMTVLSPYSDHKYYSFQKCVEISKPVPRTNSDKGYDEDQDDSQGEDSVGSDEKDANNQEGDRLNEEGAQEGDKLRAEGGGSEGNQPKSGAKMTAHPQSSDVVSTTRRKASVASEKSDIDLI